MKKALYLLVFVALMLGIACSVGVSNSKDALYQRDDSVYKDTLFFMDYEEQQLQILYSEDESKLFIASYVTLDKASLKDLNQVCFILDEDIKMNDFLINGERSEIERVLAFNENNFNVPVEHKTANRIKFLGEIWKFKIPEAAMKDDEIKIVIKYTISDQAEGEAYNQQKNQFTLNGDMFWYPTTLIDGGVLELSLDVKATYDVKANDKPMHFQKRKSYKSYDHLMQNIFAEPLTVKGLKTKK
jgi:hypothetical protein